MNIVHIITRLILGGAQENTLITCKLLVGVTLLVATEIAALANMKTGQGDFMFEDEKSNKKKNIKVYYYKPEKLAPTSRVVFVMHGNMRKAEGYRNLWAKFAREHKFLVLCPEFSEKDFPGGAGYNMGNVYTDKWDPIDKSEWVFSVIERLFDYVRDSEKIKTELYCIYGHSAGGQLVHRMVLFMPEARFSLAIAANAGYYTVPDYNSPLHCGIKGTGIDREQLKKSFSKNLVILIGEKDTIPFESQTECEKKQGENRVKKGVYFFNESKHIAEKMAVDFNWKIKKVPGADHNSNKMDEYGSKLAAISKKREVENPPKQSDTKPAGDNDNDLLTHKT
jgi:dienelactone hydrolase